jgi:ketosteroid isomerase-like protein
VPENELEIVRLVMDAVDRRDQETIERLAAETIRFESTFAAAEGRIFSGPSATRDYFAALDEAFEDVRIALEEVLETERGRVVLRARVSGRGRGSGIEIDQRYIQVWTLANDKVEEIVSRPA